MKSSFFVGCTALLMLLLHSCAPVYIPNSPMVFENEEAGEGSVKYRQGFYSTNIQGGYAVSDMMNVGASINAIHTADVTIGNTSEPGIQALELNFVTGYYNKFTASNIFELNVGAGSVFHARPAGFSDYYKLFAQPSISFKNLNDKFKFTISGRITGATFGYNDRNVDSTYYLAYGEPAFSLSFGKTVQFLIQTGISIPLQSEEIFDSSPFLFNLGIGYKFGNKRSELIEP